MVQFLYSSFLFCLQKEPGTLRVLYFTKDLTLQVECIKYLLIFRSSLPDVFCEKGVLRSFTKFTGKHLRRSLYFNKVADPTLLKQRLWHRYFPVTFAQFLRKPFLTEHLRWLLPFMIILVTLLLILKICLSVEINFWKTPLKITVKNLRSFQGTYL